ncbi:MAG: DUF2254 domain-containing protein [Caldimonas sp.]
MNARVRNFFSALGERFWLVPAVMVLAGILLAIVLVDVDRRGVLPPWLIEGAWLYDGGGTGARTLLGAVVSSTIGVAGTVFSITIAALSLAAGQMGPRLLRNFTRDRGNQATLGTFLGTFCYALMVLRSVRTQAEGEFVPHLSMSVGIVLAFVCVGTLVYFVGHMASRINVDTVIELVSGDVRAAIRRLMGEDRQLAPPDGSFWNGASKVVDTREGYLQAIDSDALAEWAASHDTVLRLLVRPGDYVFPGVPVALLTRPVDGVRDALAQATALGPQRIGPDDLEYAVRQLVEVAVRALSPGINDPHTAIGVIDRMAAALCEIAPLTFPSGVHERDGRIVLVVPSIDYDGLIDTMFHMIRQSARGISPVLIRIVEVLTAVATCERDPVRLRALERHVGLVLDDSRRDVHTPDDLRDIWERRRRFGVARAAGVGDALAEPADPVKARE